MAGPKGFEGFLRERGGANYCGPVLIGPSFVPIGAKVQLPALDLELPGLDQSPTRVRLVGSMGHIWRSGDMLDLLIITNRELGEKPSQQLCSPLLEPILCYLLIQAGSEQWRGGTCDELWRRPASCRVDIAHFDGISSYDYADCISPAEARNYLMDLTQGYLQPTTFDYMPFDLVSKTRELRTAYQIAESDRSLPSIRESYAALLRDCAAIDRERTEPYHRCKSLTELWPPHVPEDAFDKVRGRFQLLDRGPARIRSLEAS
jgi:hypothetical protein